MSCFWAMKKTTRMGASTISDAAIFRVIYLTDVMIIVNSKFCTFTLKPRKINKKSKNKYDG